MDPIENAIEEYENKTTEEFITMFEKLGTVKAMEVCERILMRLTTILSETDAQSLSDDDVARFYDLVVGREFADETLHTLNKELRALDVRIG